MMKMMYVSVREGRGEMGVGMCVGGRGIDIVWELVIECMVMRMRGGVIGVMLGWGGRLMMKSVGEWGVFMEGWRVLV